MPNHEMDKNKIDVVAFDFFDTLVHRHCNPENIISDWAKSIILRYGLTISSAFLYRLRKESESALRNNNKGDVTYEEILKKVYDSLKTLGLLEKIDFSVFYASSYNIEFKLEEKNIFLDRNVFKKAKKYFYENKKVIIISDFYFNKFFVEIICEKLHISDIIYQIFVSCDYNARKSTGELYKKVIEQFNILPSQLLMIGDNIISDQKIPRKMGIMVEASELSDNIPFCLKMIDLVHCLKSSIKSNEPFNGYSGIIYYFISKLHRNALKFGCKKLLFCSREGQILKELFDMYQSDIEEQNRIATEYIYVSRRATFLASLRKAEDENFSRMFVDYKSLKITDFLYNLGFNQQETIDVLEKTNTNATIISMPRGYDKEFDRFLNSESFISNYNRKRSEANKIFRDYIYPFIEESTLWIVDIGWRGTIQDNIYNALGNKIMVTGFYFGLKDAVQSKCNKKFGIVFDDNDSKNYKLMAFNYIDLEKVCSADHGPVDGYYREDTKVNPKIINSNSELAIFDYIKEQQNCLIKSFEKICEIFKRSIFDFEDASYYLKKQYLYHLCVMRPENYKYYYGYREIVVENFGAKNTKIINKFSFKGYSEQFRWGMVNYVFRALDRVHLRILYPVGKLYCYLIYLIKKIGLKVMLKRVSYE